MKFLRGLRHIHAWFFSQSAVCIGCFDGVHRGHQGILDKMGQTADRQGLQKVLIIFEPQPKEYFYRANNQDIPPRIYRLSDKVCYVREFGLDFLCCLVFCRSLSECPFHVFVENFLCATLKMKHVFVGEDFRFGRGKEGDSEALVQLGEKHAFEVDVVPHIKEGGQRISSSRIREALLAGKFNLAKRMLGREYQVMGSVVRGKQLGTTVTSFPTVNLTFHAKNPPLRGVYVVRILIEYKWFFGVANAGVRPTFDGKNYCLEIHVFHFNRKIYASKVSVEPLALLRQERKFSSVQGLKNQIVEDITKAHAWVYANEYMYPQG